MRKLRFFYWLIAATPLLSQAPPPQKLSFEVASIKRSAPDARGFRLGSSGGRFFATNVTLRILLGSAYSPHDGPLLKSRVIGVPDWIDTDRFDIEAKTEETSTGRIPQEKLRPMLQSLLEDRFQLKAHWEVRQLPVYNLIVAKGGPKLKLSEDQTPPTPVTGPLPPSKRPGEAPVLPRGVFGITPSPGGLTLSGIAIPILNIVSYLQAQIGQPIFDKTDLKALVDISLQFAPDVLSANPSTVPTDGAQPPLPPDPSAPSLFTAIQDLGLKLEAAKAPLEVLVIDHIERPSEN